MQEPREEDLILYYYGEARNAAAIRRRLDTSPAAAERYAELCRTLELVDAQPVPEPFDDYGERVWRRLEPRLEESSVGDRARDWLSRLIAPSLGARIAPSRLAAGATVAALVVIAFLAGRSWSPVAPAVGEPLSAAGRERILLVSVGEHLERSEMLLIELANAPGDDANLAGELRRAEELLPFNRLYRQAARRSGQARIAEVLDDLERLLLDLAHSGELSPADQGELRQRIDSGGILFRVQVVSSLIEHQQQRPRTPATSGEA